MSSGKRRDSSLLIADRWLLAVGCWLLAAGCWLLTHFPRHPPCAPRGEYDILHICSPKSGRASFFDNRELEIKENYDSYTRSSEKVSC